LQTPRLSVPHCLTGPGRRQVRPPAGGAAGTIRRSARSGLRQGGHHGQSPAFSVTRPLAFPAGPRPVGRGARRLAHRARQPCGEWRGQDLLAVVAHRSVLQCAAGRPRHVRGGDAAFPTPSCSCATPSIPGSPGRWPRRGPSTGIGPRPPPGRARTPEEDGLALAG